MNKIDPKTLQLIASVLEVGAATTASVAGGDVAAGAKIADSLLLLIQKGISAYESQTGKPMDRDLLRPFEPLTE